MNVLSTYALMVPAVGAHGLIGRPQWNHRDEEQSEEPLPADQPM
jgi:hypothetical protein